ncbi:MAG: hypothetical protein AB1861_11585 [Cyanobacteriota bacterium]
MAADSEGCKIGVSVNIRICARQQIRKLSPEAIGCTQTLAMPM